MILKNQMKVRIKMKYIFYVTFFIYAVLVYNLGYFNGTIDARLAVLQSKNLTAIDALMCVREIK